MTGSAHDGQQGLSLVELLVGLTVGLLVIMAALSIYAAVAIGARDTLGSARLNAEIRAAMDVMANHIRRAGFGGAAFSEPGHTDIAIYESGTCLVYSYDADLNGDLSTITPYEYFGFRVEGKELQVRYNSGDLSACDGESRSWERLTDRNILEIDEVDDGEAYFTIEYQCIRSQSPTTTAEIGINQRCASGGYVYDAAATAANASGKHTALVETRKVKIVLPAHLTSDESMQIKVSDEVLVRNHRIVIIVPAS